MPSRSLPIISSAPPELSYAAVRKRLAVPEAFPAEVEAAAAAAAQAVRPGTDDRRGIPLVTIDPPGSTDLDQALCIERRGSGFRIWYAIADMASFVPSAGPVDAEARRRGETLYCPDTRTTLHPTVLSEGAASLLPGQDRPAALWRIDLDGSGAITGVDVRRAAVRSIAQLDYVGVQRGIDADSAHPSIADLLAVGEVLAAQARSRHAVELDVAEQEVEKGPDGAWTLKFRRTLPVEKANAQISLLTGRCAADLMLQAKIGIVRTVPEPGERQVDALRRIAHSLRIDWPDGAAVGDVVSAVDAGSGPHDAFLAAALHLMRGADYTSFDGTAPSDAVHAGVGAPYAHVTAPLRRLADRFGSEVCLAVSGGATPPDWVRAALPELPRLMAESAHRAGELDHAVLDLTEAWLLHGRIGERFTAVVLEAGDHTVDGNGADGQHPSTIAVAEPAVRARCDGDGLQAGQEISVVLKTADIEKPEVRFALS
ncbi:MAG: RNB domain-containing ribonuclease [Mycobacteriales bacterium]